MAKESNQNKETSVMDDTIPTPGLIVEIRVGWNIGNGDKKWLGSAMVVDPTVSFDQAGKCVDNVHRALAETLLTMREDR